jgi:hypothetical protein
LPPGEDVVHGVGAATRRLAHLRAHVGRPVANVARNSLWIAAQRAHRRHGGRIEVEQRTGEVVAGTPASRAEAPTPG